MKIPLQEKIAELEARIVELEKKERWRGQAEQRKTDHTIITKGGGIPSERMRHWHKMWEEFNLAMKDMFE